MARQQFLTVKGYDFFEVTSAMQKSIRRGRAPMAAYWALELFNSGMIRYVWKRLLIIAQEDCFGAITHEVMAIHKAFMLVNDAAKWRKLDNPEGKLFVVKVALLLSACKKSRDADHLICLLYEKDMVSHEVVMQTLTDVTEADKQEIPEYALDKHTRRGKMMGKTENDFFHDEQKALTPVEPGLFDEMALGMKK